MMVSKDVSTKQITLIGLISLTLLFLNAGQAQAQSACDGPETIVISFPELDPPGTVSFNDANYRQAILTSGIEPADVKINFDPEDTKMLFPFDVYFDAEFRLNPTPAYYVIMKTPIDRDGLTSAVEDDQNLLQYQLACTNNFGDTTVFYKVLKIQITDVNDNAPFFTQQLYFADVSELTPVRTTVYNDIETDDLDEGGNKLVSYSLIRSPGAEFDGTEFFELPNVQEGIISLKKNLVFEIMYRQTRDTSNTFYNLTVIATDHGNPPRSSSALLILTIKDEDDQGPELVYPSCIPSSEQFGKQCIRAKYRSSLPPISTQSSYLQFTPVPSDINVDGNVDIVMQDRDTLNSSIDCRIATTEPTGYAGYFTASSTQVGTTKQYKCYVQFTGVSPLIRKSIPTLDLVVEVVEQSLHRRVDYATVIVSNNSPPSIQASSNIGYIYENSLLSTLVSEDVEATAFLQLTFSDPDVSTTDSRQGLRIDVSDGSPFTVTDDGHLQLANDQLDFETTSSYTFTVTVTETGTVENYSASVTLTVNVLDINDNNPVFDIPEKYYAVVPAGDYSISKRLLLTVSATDKDFGPPIYSVTKILPDGSDSKFSLDSATGRAELQGAVEVGDNYYIYVKATDSGSPARFADTIIVVTVTDHCQC